MGRMMELVSPEGILTTVEVVRETDRSILVKGNCSEAWFPKKALDEQGRVAPWFKGTLVHYFLWEAPRRQSTRPRGIPGAFPQEDGMETKKRSDYQQKILDVCRGPGGADYTEIKRALYPGKIALSPGQRSGVRRALDILMATGDLTFDPHQKRWISR